MAWYSSSLAFAVRPEDAVRVADAVALQNAWTKDTPFVHAMSRNGVLLATVNAINMQCAPGRDIYLNQQFSRLQDADLAKAHEQVEALIDCIDKNPGAVLEATKLPYTPHFFIHSKEFKPLRAEMVYPSDAIIQDGYVIQYTEDQVRQMLGDATASEDPRPSNDDDGESLEYVFNFLKSHHRLLGLAVKSNLVILCGELS